ncbi:MAG: hypothetical protein CVV39_04130 [Planctomycetes bacterium HGW-Planctomycetes-1]|nr:MAG: hypothetical protein CVV39_04130 [Planctomycetes bacterium HGW-Planctomycetes-1]
MAMNGTFKKISVSTLAFCFIFVSAITGCRRSSPQKANTPAEDTTSGISKSLNKIISGRKGWNPILKDFYGKAAADFTVTDITGKTHKLSDYKGKDVLVVFWATWCQPCVLEIPHLVALRDIMGEDKLAILAISNEPAELVRKMAKDKDINYTAISYQGVLSEPFNQIRAIPSSFFIRPDGTLKLAVEGMSHLGEMKAIILAE